MATTTQTETWRVQQKQYLQRAQLLLDQATREQRALTADEEKQHGEWLAIAESIGKKLDRREADDQLAAEVDQLYGRQRSVGSQPESARGSSAGDLFASGVGDFFKSGGHRSSGSWRSPAVEIPYASMFAATLTEDPASGGKLVVPQYTAIQPLPTRPIVVMDLLMPGTTESNSIAVMIEKTFTNAASPVAEGAAKPESALTFDQVPEPVNKIAHWLPCTEEILEDVSGMRSYIDGRLRQGVQLAEDDQILNGNGTPPNFRGILNRTGLAPTITQGTDTVADAIAKQIAAIATTAFVPATGVVINPSDWLAVLLSKTSTGDYYGNGPFGPVSAPSLWSLPVAVTSAIAAKTVLVGAFATQAQFFRKGGLRVEASNSHQDFFVKNLVAIRAEERGALAVYRPASFGKVTLT